MFGFLNINKPPGVSSHKIVSVLRRILGEKRIGHGGTLDPLASGLLPFAVGKASKLIDYLPAKKRYLVGLEFGKRSDTYDIEGKIEELQVNPVNLEQIKSVLPMFNGEVKQVPPAYSAVHYKGKRLYELARAGNIPNDIPSRLVNIYDIAIVSFDENSQKLELDITCSKGTYIRSIVNDIAETLNTGAIMYKLTRTESGGMSLDSALNIDENITKESVLKKLINPLSLLTMDYIEISKEEYKIILNGNQIYNRLDVQDNVLILLVYNREIIALGSVSGSKIQPKKLLV